MRRIVCSFMFTLVTIAVASAQQAPTTAPPARAVLPAGLPAEPGQARPTTPPPAAPASTPRPGASALAPPATGSGQTPPPSAPVAATPQAGRAQTNYVTQRDLSWQNVKLDVSITDSLTADSQSRKSVSMLVLDGRSGQVRSTGGAGVINVDAIPTIRPDGRVYLQLTLEYQPELSAQQNAQTGGSRVTMFNESLSLIIADGKPLIASQSSDPRSDRKVTVEVTATVVR